ncbi:YbbR-like domain-containing protein [Pontibacter beigongshangensis]|uniref:hypothetical protein n=1 Tax=Pontibacter beigongshangensis TaxID=2574733 RepID=UPI00293BD197|nr:hypothetical protein [Pontibacter beigongshangensis]
MAASTFWLLNALNKSYSTQTTYPIRFVYPESRLVPVKPLPEEIIINVTGKGWKLLRKSLKVDVKPAEVQIGSLPRNNYVLGSSLRPALVNSLDGLVLNFVVTDTIYFDFDEKIRRRVALNLDPKQEITEDRFSVVGPVQIEPDSITFLGPATMVNSIPDPFLLRLPGTLSASAKLEIPINFDNKPLVKANAEQAIVTVNVQALVQEERQIIPEIVNAPAGHTLNLRPSFVLVRYQLLEDSVAVMNRDTFRAVLDFAKYNPRDSTLVPELIQKPTGARRVRIWPERIKAVVEADR